MNSNDVPFSNSREWLLESKLRTPHTKVRLISRPALQMRMNGWLDLDLAVITAPAGYAKSTTAAEWCRSVSDDSTSVAWLSLDEADGEPSQFLSYVIASLCSAGLKLEWLESSAREGFLAGGVSEALLVLLQEIAAHSHPVILAIDDYHRLSSPEVDDLLQYLLQNIPPNLTLVLLSRTSLPFSVAPLIAAGRADLITAENLRFSLDEIAALFEQPITQEALNGVLRKTEGWPVATQLVRLLMDGAFGSAAFESFHGDSGHFASYLAEQILDKLPPDAQNFLLKTSILERFNMALADEILGRADSARILADLSVLDAFIVPMQENGIAFRYHHLFREFLQAELGKRFAKADIDALHQTASFWYKNHGFVPDAVRHARLVLDYDRCAQLIADEGGWELILFGGIGYLRGLLQNIPDSKIDSYPRILLAKAYLSLKDGLIGQARALFDSAAQHSSAQANDRRLKRDMLNLSALLGAYEDRHFTTADVGALKADLDRRPSDDPVTLAILSCRIILYELAIGDLASAELRAQTTMRLMRQARSVLGLNYCYLHAGLSAMYQGRLKAAEAHFGVAERMAEENFAFDPGLRAVARILAHCLRYWQGEKSADQDDQFLSDLAQVEHYDGWYDIYAAALVVEHAQQLPSLSAIERGRRIADLRGLRRLEMIADTLALGTADGAENGRMALSLQKSLPDEIWRRDRFYWLPFVRSRIAFAHYFGTSDRARAIACLTDGIACCETIGAVLFATEMLVMRAQFLEQAGSRNLAIDDVIEALSRAAPEGMSRPFLIHRATLPLLRAVIRYAQNHYVDILVIAFARALVERLAKPHHSLQGEDCQPLLSAREQEVLEELSQGRSNKEIARMLDMTEHTVKFHLKNLFGKLSVDRRALAIVRARELHLV